MTSYIIYIRLRDKGQISKDIQVIVGRSSLNKESGTSSSVRYYVCRMSIEDSGGTA